jgi:glucokinase
VSQALALLADIGGTHARFALADTQHATPLVDESIRQFEVSAFASLNDAAAFYLREVSLPIGRARQGVFAVAGRVDGDIARITNHPWLISRPETVVALGLGRLQLVNDFAAQAMAVNLLAAHSLAAIGPPMPALNGSADCTFAVLGPGTGLGVSAMLRREGRSHVLQTEGGHVSFAATDALEAAVLERLALRFGRVSNERLISGSGLVNLHRALAEIDGITIANMQPHEVSAGAAKGDPLCRRAVDLFCAVFGAIAGDLVLTLGAWDGVYLTGGLVPKLLSELKGSAFRARFEAKGRFAPAMAGVPTLAVLHPQAGLLGAAAFAQRESLGAAR